MLQFAIALGLQLPIFPMILEGMYQVIGKRARMPSVIQNHANRPKP